MKKIAGILTIIALAFPLFLQAQTSAKPSNFTRLDRIVAVVNSEVITQSQLNAELERTKKQFEQANQPVPAAGELRTKILDALIAKSLTLQLAKKKGITASEDDVNKAVDHIVQMNKIDLAKLKEALQQQGMTFDAYKKNLSEQILMQKVQQDEIAKTITVTPEDVQRFVRENKDKLSGYNAFHVIDITMPIAENASNTQIDSLRKQAGEVSGMLQKGKSVDEILKQYPYAQNNDLGWRSMGELPSIFQAKVASMAVKSTSTPIQAPNGFHVLQLLDAKGQNPKLSDADLKNLAFQQKVSAGIKTWIDKLRQESYVKVMN